MPGRTRKPGGATGREAQQRALREKQAEAEAGSATVEQPALTDAPVTEATSGGEDQAIKELAAELGVSEDVVREQMADDATASPDAIEAQAEPAVELAIVDETHTVEPDGTEVHTATFESAEEAEAAKQHASEEAINAAIAAGEKMAEQEAAASEVSATEATEPVDLAMEVRVRLESGVTPSEIISDALVLAMAESAEALTAAVTAELESLVPQLQTEAEVGQWWTARLSPDGPARRIAKLLPPVYVADEDSQIFLPLQHIADDEVEAYNAAHTPQVHSNGTASHPDGAQQQPDPRAEALAILKALRDGRVDDLPPREVIERALASLETVNAQQPQAPRARSVSQGSSGTTRRLAPDQTAPTHDKDGNELPSRKLYRAKAVGPFLVGASNAAGGTVVRDTRLPVKEWKPESDKVFEKAAAAKAYVDEQIKKVKDADKAKFEEALKARFGPDGTAR